MKRFFAMQLGKCKRFPAQETTDDIVSSAECSSDDEDFIDCEPSTGGELVVPLLVEDPLDIPPIATRAPFITLPPTFRPLLTIIETTKDSLSMTSEAGLPCLSDQGSDGCDDDGLVISGYGSGETFDSNLPPTDDEDFYTTFSLVTDKSLSTSIFEGGYKAHAPKWESKDFRPNKVSETGRTTTTSLSPELIRSTASSSTGMVPKLPAGKMNNRELKPQPDIVLLPLPTAYELDSTKLKSPLITSPMFRNVPTANPTEPGIRRVPGASEVVRESSSTTGMVVGIVAAAALCILILLYAMYKYRNRDEGSYQKINKEQLPRGAGEIPIPTLTGEHSTARRLMLSAGAEHGGTPAPVPVPLPGLQPAPWESTVQLWAGKPPKTTR
ncbi:Neurexin-3-alpha [Anas platyrhynchos]|uniref:Neurexin-3-alpha n=1 Tax=Anas platyrhynchos TaxID=8839 RepID=R0K6T1_ANAPL|nr:Neurexin-3-alpha [Anas platyrhynchos]